ncbi:MAG: DNA mismatch endonuclease Vsr [Gammaproteobacteria bacterium]|nr:DNA mismatch endonuclease Vsr [Gammaproteobacteria bacterium]MDD9864352.1 DNA mismatch endonuclease Vsr [Gammaproteobacteria bacterium]
MDIFSPEKRREIMQRVRLRNTAPERAVRSILHRLGFRFRLHARKLPGKPDIVLPKYNTVIFVHGCFWHRHVGCPRASTPASRQEYWLPKFQRTVQRDKENRQKIRGLGWNVITVWECELKKPESLTDKLETLIRHASPHFPVTPLPLAKAAEQSGKYRTDKKG